MPSAELIAFNKILVTGAPGWLCDALLPNLPSSANIRCLIQSSIPDETLKSWHAKHPEVSEIVRGDMGDAASLMAACENMNGGVVLHAAGVIHPRTTGDWYRINRDGTLALARAAKAAGARRFVFISSNAAQGAATSASQILTEKMPCKPLSHYGQSKLEAERGLVGLHNHGMFDAVIARPCMFYGPPVPERHVAIFKRIQRGKLPLVGDGNYARSLTYIDDLVAGTILCASHPAAAGETFNLCDARPYTTLEVCEAMAAALKVPARFLRIPAFSAPLAYRIDRALAALGFYSMNFHLLGEADWNVGCSSEKAATLLGYRTTVDVFEGYRRAVEWCRSERLLD